MLLTYLRTITDFYKRHERKLNSAGMLSGLLVDLFIFNQTNLKQQIFILVFYISVAAFGITIINAYEGGRLRLRFLQRLRLWLPLIIQYAFGGLFGAFVVLYIQNASFLASWPFFIILASLLVGNELFRKQYLRLTFHTAVFFLALFSFNVFYLPVILDRLGPEVFITGSVLSLIIIAGFIGWLSKITPTRIQRARDGLILTIGAIFVLMQVLYFSGRIPPIPLAMRAGGVYHQVRKIDHQYQVWYESRPWYEYFSPSQTIHLRSGEPVYVFTSIFAPAKLDITILHHWQFFDPKQGRWISRSKIKYPITGGRSQGYRGYSLKQNIEPGRWRVDVETPSGQIIGRIPFTVELTDNPPPLKSKIF